MQIDFISTLHETTTRDYIGRMNLEKPEIAKIAKKFDYDFWDGNRKYGYGGFHYDGRWKPVAEKLIKYYNLKDYDRVLDVGCGKGYLLYEIQKLNENIEVQGIDISNYAIENSKEEIKSILRVGNAIDLPYENEEFDLVISLNTLHNLYIFNLEKAINEIERVKKENSYIVVEAYQTEREKFNLMCWNLTGECYFTDREWEWLYSKFNYTGDYSFIYFK